MDEIDELAVEIQQSIKENNKRLEQHHIELYGEQPSKPNIEELFDEDLEV